MNGLPSCGHQSMPGRSDSPVKPTSEVAHQPGQQPAAILRPNGRPYRPRKISAYAVGDEDEFLSGVCILGTHDLAMAQLLADNYAAWQLGCGSTAHRPETGWFREGYASGRPTWIRDPVRGRAGIMFHELIEAP